MKAFLAKLQGWGWALLAVAAAVMALVVKGLFTKGKATGDGKLLPDPPKKLLEKKTKAEEKAMVVRAEVKVKTAADKEKLAQLTNISDGEQRRRELAKFLDDL